MQRKSASKYYHEITLSSNQLSTRTRQPRLHVMPAGIWRTDFSALFSQVLLAC